MPGNSWAEIKRMFRNHSEIKEEVKEEVKAKKAKASEKKEEQE